MRASYEDHIARRVAADFPAECGKLGAGLADFIRQGIEKAGSYRIDGEGDVSRYIELRLKFGMDFESLDEMKWAAAILQDESISGHAKIDLICGQLPLHQSQAE